MSGPKPLTPPLVAAGATRSASASHAESVTVVLGKRNICYPLTALESKKVNVLILYLFIKRDKQKKIAIRLQLLFKNPW